MKINKTLCFCVITIALILAVNYSTNAKTYINGKLQEVNRIIGGAGISISPSDGVGTVTISCTGGGGSSFTNWIAVTGDILTLLGGNRSGSNIIGMTITSVHTANWDQAAIDVDAINSRTNDWNMRVESIVVQDPTNNLAAPYWLNVPTNATLHRVMAQSWGCTGIVDVVKKGWLEPMNDYDTLQTDIPAQLTATVLESGSLTNQTLVHTNNLGVVFSEIDNFSITNRMDVYLWYTIP
jgi:hypothetical protein